MWRCWVVAVVCYGSYGGYGGVCWAQEEPTHEELKKMYDGALAQLKSAQISKNELAGENDKLRAKLAELEKQLTDTQAQMQELKRQASAWGDKTFFLRAHYAAWQSFIDQFPSAKARWKVFFDSSFLPASRPDPFDRDWPLSCE